MIMPQAHFVCIPNKSIFLLIVPFDWKPILFDMAPVELYQAVCNTSLYISAGGAFRQFYTFIFRIEILQLLVYY